MRPFQESKMNVRSVLERIVISIVLGIVISFILMIVSSRPLLTVESAIVILINSITIYFVQLVTSIRWLKKLNNVGGYLEQVIHNEKTVPKQFEPFILKLKQVVENKELRINELEKKVAVTTDVINKINKTVSNQEDSYNEFNSIIFELSNGIHTQSEAAKETSHAMVEIAQGINHIAETSGVTSSSSLAASQTAQTGKQLVLSVINQMNKINSSFSTLANTVREFEVRTNEISTIIEEISNIANQTNLLSLNASIEAARAGNEGKGFAVVASEVGKLSKQSNLFAERISEVIKGIQIQSKEANEAMTVSKDDVVSGLDIVDNLTTSFESIKQATDTINKQIHDISAVSQQLAASSEEVASSSEEVMQISKKSSEYFNVIVPLVIEQFDVTNTVAETINKKDE